MDMRQKLSEARSKLPSRPSLPSLPSLPRPSAPAGLAEGWRRVRESPTLAILVSIGAVLVCGWIGWTIYVSAENGINAGLGVLISWPAVLMALALLVSPFVGGWVLIRRLTHGDQPAIAGDAPTDE